MLTQEQAHQALELSQAHQRITADDVRAILKTRKGIQFAGITAVTPVSTAKAHRARCIQKVTQASVQLAASLNDFSTLYANAVKRSAGVEEFQVSDSWHEHTDCFSIVAKKSDPSCLYLYAIFNNADSLYFVDGKSATREQVAEYLTPSEAKRLLEPTQTTYNKTNDVEHSVVVRTIALDNLVSIRANGEEVNLN